MGRSVGFVAVVALVSCGGDAERSEATGEVTAPVRWTRLTCKWGIASK